MIDFETIKFVYMHGCDDKLRDGLVGVKLRRGRKKDREDSKDVHEVVSWLEIDIFLKNHRFRGYVFYGSSTFSFFK